MTTVAVQQVVLSRTQINEFFYFKYMIHIYAEIINKLAETPGVARDYIRNEGTRKINLVLYKNN
jgi:hypothetical protein